MSDAIVYSFWATYPKGGYCESKHGPGPLGPIQEPGNVLFCLVSTLFGVLGIFKSRQNMSAAIMYLYALITGYGVMKALQHAFILNGLDKISETTLLKIVQMLIVPGLAVCVRNKWPVNQLPSWMFGLMFCATGIYPAVAMVWSSSDLNPWVGWLTFDLVWLIILPLLLIIWFSRQSYAVEDNKIFDLVWYIILTIVVGYIFWLVDEFQCNYLVARLYLHGWWHIFLAWGFYHAIVLIAYLLADSYHYQPVATFWPDQKYFVIATVQWVEVQCAKED